MLLLWRNVILLHALFDCNVGATSLDQTYMDLSMEVLKTSQHCTLMLYGMDRTDASSISAKSDTPLMIVDDIGKTSIGKLTSLLSIKQSRCAVIFALDSAGLNGSIVENLLNDTKLRTVFVFQTKENNKALQDAFKTHFKDCVIFVQQLLSGNLLLSSFPMRQMMWLKRARDVYTRDPGFTLSKNSVRSTLKGRNVVVSSLSIPPFAFLLPNKRYAGNEIDALHILADKVGFKFEVRPEKVAWHRDPKTLEWSGSVRTVHDGLSQFATTISGTTGFGVSYPLIHYGPITAYEQFRYLVPKPRPISPFNNFVRPFTPTVWFCLLASLVACSIVSPLLNLAYGDSSLSPWRIVFDLFGSIWQQKLKDSLVSPTSGVYFIIFGFWISGMFFKAAAYNCNLRAFIVKVEYQKPIETDEDFLASNIDLFIPFGMGLAEMFQTSASLTKRELYARVIRRKTYFPYVDGISPYEVRMVKEGGGRLILKSRSKLIIAAYEKYLGFKLPMRVTNFSPFSIDARYVMPLNQPWTDEIDMIVLHLIEGGIADKLKSRYLPPERTEEHKREEEIEPYRVEHVAGPLMVLGFGLLLSIIAVCYEVVHYKFFKSEDERKLRSTFSLTPIVRFEDERN